MILADKIIEERKKNGWSQEELAELLGVSRQAVSKWESAGAVPDLQRIIRMAELFGVSTDYLLKDDMLPENKPAVVNDGDTGCLRRVGMEEANDFLALKRVTSEIVANAASMCILSPALLIILSGLAESSIGRLTENIAALIGCIVLFGMIAAAVYMFITIGLKNARTEHLERTAFETEYGVDGMVREKSREYEGRFSSFLALGVVLCIVAVVPLVIVSCLEAAEYIICIFTAVLLLLIAVGVNLIIRAAVVKSSFDTLLQQGEFSISEKRTNARLGALSGVYWCIALAVYLAWSFYTMRWHMTWIVWPVAGVLYAAVKGIARMVTNTNEL